jgi:hypothetical protein
VGAFEAGPADVDVALAASLSRLKELRNLPRAATNRLGNVYAGLGGAFVNAHDNAGLVGAASGGGAGVSVGASGGVGSGDGGNCGGSCSGDGDCSSSRLYLRIYPGARVSDAWAHVTTRWTAALCCLRWTAALSPDSAHSRCKDNSCAQLRSVSLYTNFLPI